jgi:hypothetical protein
MKIDLNLKRIILFLYLPFLFLGCVTANNPNIPFSKPIDEILYIELHNPLFAKELRKLPEIQDGLTKEEKKGLKQLSDLYRSKPAKFDAAFKEMYDTGLPEYRKYCSPLQALFWISVKYSFSIHENLVKTYNMNNLLNQAWTFTPQMSPEQIKRIVASIKDDDIRAEYQNKIKENNKYIISALMNYASHSPEIFENWAHEELKKNRNNNSWNDYDTVLDRLNSPELVHYYVKKLIRYSNFWEIPGYTKEFGQPRYVFKNKAGDCLYTSSFIVEALKRNGYSAWVEKKPPLRSVDAWHAVGVFNNNGTKYIIDDGRMFPRGIKLYHQY